MATVAARSGTGTVLPDTAGHSRCGRPPCRPGSGHRGRTAASGVRPADAGGHRNRSPGRRPLVGCSQRRWTRPSRALRRPRSRPAGRISTSPARRPHVGDLGAVDAHNRAHPHPERPADRLGFQPQGAEGLVHRVVVVPAPRRPANPAGGPAAPPGGRGPRPRPRQTLTAPTHSRSGPPGACCCLPPMTSGPLLPRLARLPCGTAGYSSWVASCDPGGAAG